MQDIPREINPESVLQALREKAVCSILHTHLPDFDRFAAYILAWMEREESGPERGESEVNR